MQNNKKIRINEIPSNNKNESVSVEIPPPQQEEDKTTGALPFPLEYLNHTQRELVDEIINVYGQDPGVVGITSCSVLAGAMGRSFLAEGGVPGLITAGNIFSLIGLPRSGGKGTVSGFLMKPLVDANSELQKNFRDNLLPTFKIRHRQIKNQLDALHKSKELPDQESLITLQREFEQIERQLKYSPAILSGSATGAALVESLARNDEQLMLFSPEAGDAVKVALGRYTSDGGTDIDLMLSGFSGEPFSESRVGRGNNHLEKPCISTLWFVQPVLLRELLSNQQAIERGLAARFLYATSSQKEVPFDDGSARSLRHEYMERWNSLVRGILRRRDNPPITVSCHPDAQEIFRDFHNIMVELRNGLYRDIQGDLGRAREIAIRLALGQCVADAMSRKETPTILQPEHAERGVAIARYSYSQFVHITAPLREEIGLGKLKKVLDLCVSINGKVTVARLKNNHGFTETEISNLIDEYPNKIMMQTLPVGSGGGRPSRVIVRIS